jgi:AbrB family looped-hinge helix DNA binding protein
MNSAYVTSKGRLVVPSRIRRRYGIKPGTRINFVEEGDRIIFQPVTREYIDSFCGIFKLKPGEKSAVRQHLEERRAERGRKRQNSSPPTRISSRSKR